MLNIFDLCKALPLRTFVDGSIIIEEGTKTGRLYILKKGKVEILRSNKSINIMDEVGTILGEIAILLDVSHTATCKAVGEVEVYVIDNAIEYLVNHPELSIFIAKSMAVKLNWVMIEYHGHSA